MVTKYYKENGKWIRHKKANTQNVENNTTALTPEQIDALGKVEAVVMEME